MLVLPYNIKSMSAHRIASGLGIQKALKEGGPLKKRHTILNWGCSHIPDRLLGCPVINHPDSIATAANKLRTFQALDQVRLAFNPITVPWTTSHQVAIKWLQEGDSVACRTVLNGKGAKGIVLADSVEELVQAGLYTRFVRAEEEYRVHVVGGEVIDYTKKGKRNGAPKHRLRNWGNGYVFMHKINKPNQLVLDAGKLAVEGLGLHFGAVDILWDGERAWVLEVNTAPGIEGTTLRKYIEAFQKYLGND